jgi:3-hydroxyisobutyrate dehydrogenase-like beta-hydroxyacid dehydrogenase
MKIGFIGLGAMGRHMAANLQRAGHALQVHDVRPETAVPGTTWSDSPRAAAEECEVLFTSLPGPPEVQAVCEALQGVMRPGAAWFELSTNSPDCVRRIHGVMAAQGVEVLDAPVSGGPAGARSARLAIWVGGERSAFERCAGVLRSIGDQALHVGPIGAGTVAKLVHNCATFGIQALLAEAFTLGVKAGVEPLELFRALRQGASGRKRTFDRLADNFLLGDYDPASFALRLAHKDVSLALALAREQRVPMRLAGLALEELTEAMNRGWAERDARVSMLLQEERAGVSPRVAADRLREVLEGE